MEKTHRSRVRQTNGSRPQRAAPKIVSALLGTVIIADITQAAGRVSAEPGRFLVLTGTIAYTDPRQGFAIIGSSLEDTHLARPGDQLPDGSSIREIYPKHVVLEYGGRLETVGMHELGEPAGTTHVRIPPPPPLRPPTSEPRSAPLPNDMRASGTTSNEYRSYATQPADATQGRAQPEAPLPSAPDPANEFNEERLQRAAGREK